MRKRNFLQKVNKVMDPSFLKTKITITMVIFVGAEGLEPPTSCV